jgi:hypothetical protein
LLVKEEQMKKIIFSLLSMITVFVISTSSVYAQVDLWPFHVGDIYISSKHDSATPQNNWTLKYEVLNTVTIGSYDYYTLGIWDYLPGRYDEVILRSTETEVYGYEGSSDVLLWQIAPVGTIWSIKAYNQGPLNRLGRNRELAFPFLNPIIKA